MKDARTWVRLLALCVSAGLVVGCSTAIQLTAAGDRVQHVSDTDIPGGCNLLGDVAVGIPPDAAQPPTRDDLLVLLRNKAGENGATHMAVDQAQEHTGDAGGVWWRGRGRAYACPADATVPGPLTAGGEDGPSEDEPSEDGPSEDGLSGDMPEETAEED